MRHPSEQYTKLVSIEWKLSGALECIKVLRSQNYNWQIVESTQFAFQLYLSCRYNNDAPSSVIIMWDVRCHGSFSKQELDFSHGRTFQRYTPHSFRRVSIPVWSRLQTSLWKGTLKRVD